MHKVVDDLDLAIVSLSTRNRIERTSECLDLAYELFQPVCYCVVYCTVAVSKKKRKIINIR